MKLKKYKSIFATLAALALLATACTKIDEDADNICNSATGTTVSVTIPIGIAEQETTAPASRTAAMPASSRTTAATAPAPTAATTAKLTPSPQEGFTVSFGEPMTTTDAPATRAIAKELTNVWVLQFDNAGNRVSTDCISSLAAGAPLTASKLQIGTGHTIYVVANGPALGSTDAFLFLFSPLADFEGTMLYTTAVTDAAKLPLSGKLTGVSVVDLGDTGKISLPDATPATVVMRRIHAEVTLTVDFGVTGYDLTDAQLYNVPVGTNYGWNNATGNFPNNTNDVNFTFIDTADPGMSSLTPTISGTKTTYQWFIGDNRRGDVAGITSQTDRYSGKAPAYSTFARITLTNSTNSAIKIYYDIYLGSGDVKNFDVKRNHTYNVTVAIKGTASFQEALIDIDDRLSSVGIPVSIPLTDSKADSPFFISPKSMESTVRMDWGPTNQINTTNIYDGKVNTEKIINLNKPNEYLAAQYCRNLGTEWYLPAQVELMLMYIYLPAVPSDDRPEMNSNFWSSTERNTNQAWYMKFSLGYLDYDNYKTVESKVRCVKKL